MPWGVISTLRLLILQKYTPHPLPLLDRLIRVADRCSYFVAVK